MTDDGQAPRSILVFGASAHIGGPLAEHVLAARPDIRLRLATSSPAKAAALARAFPTAEVAVADYLDTASLVAAMDGMNGVFLVTPDFFDEMTGMARFIDAVRASRRVDHIVRIVADTPGMSLDKLPRELRTMGPGPAHQHFEAQLMLNASGLPVTYLNSLGYYMDDFLIHFAPPLRAARTLLIPYDRQMCFTDTSELGEAAARLLIEGPARHAGRYYEFNSGEPARRFSEVAALMSEVTGETIAYDPTPAAFLDALGPVLREITGDDRAARYFIVNWEMERDHQAAFVGSPFAERILGRPPRTLRQWMEIHRAELLG